MRLPSCSSLQSSGALGVAIFWLRFLLGGTSLGATIYSIVLISLTRSEIWVKAVSPAALVVEIFLMLCSVLCFASLLLLVLGIGRNSAIPDLWYYLSIVFSFACHTLFAILLSFSTHSRADLYARDLEDHCSRRYWEADVSTFTSTYKTEFSRRAFVNQRTTGQYASIAAFIGIWLPVTLALVLCTGLLAGQADRTTMMVPPIESRPEGHQERRPTPPSPRRVPDDEYVAVASDHPPEAGKAEELHVDAELPAAKRPRRRASGSADWSAEADADGTG
jgi:hypothetical protein